MSSNSAEYMRLYRARQKARPTEETTDTVWMLKRIEELEGNNRRLQETIVFLDEEIVRLKRELAARPTPEGEAWERDAWVAEAHKPVVYQPTILPPTRPDDRPIGTFGVPRPAPKPAPRKR